MGDTIHDAIATTLIKLIAKAKILPSCCFGIALPFNFLPYLFDIELG